MPLPPNNIPPKKHWFRRCVAVAMLLLWIGGLSWVVVNRDVVTDWWALRNYQAPAEISRLAVQGTMTDYGRKLFYINYPVLDNKSNFNQACPNNGGEQTIVLGCYRGGQSGIFLLRVNDPRLNGVEQVTAAHEMLHSGYERLSAKERAVIDGLLTDYYEKQLKDERIKGVIDAYRKSEPNDVVNEMHSIFGTEVANLPTGLEEYYARYFTNRQQVVEYAAQYQAEFTSRQDTITRYDEQLSDAKQKIDTAEAELKAKQTAITNREQALNALRDSDVTAYNAGVPGFNQLVDSYNAQIKQVRQLINNYNQLVQERNDVATEQDELIKELSNDTQPMTR